MQKIPIPRYRTAPIFGAGYTVVFVSVAMLRLWWAEEVEIDLPSAALLMPDLVLLWVVGSLSFLPLIWTLRRFRGSHWIPIVHLRHRAPFLAVGSALRRPPWTAWGTPRCRNPARAGRWYLFRNPGHSEPRAPPGLSRSGRRSKPSATDSGPRG